jgi:hypothetical protein
LGKLLYDNYLLDVPTMLDLSLLFGHGSTANTLAQSLNRVLELQPKFMGDLESAAQMLAKVNNIFKKKCYMDSTAIGYCRVLQLTNKFPQSIDSAGTPSVLLDF